MALRKKRLITCTFLFLSLIIGGVMYSNSTTDNLNLGQKPQHPQNLQHVADTSFNSNKSNTSHNKELESSTKSASITESFSTPAGTEKKDTTKYDANDADDKVAAESNQSSTLLDAQITNAIQHKVGEPIEPTDLFQAVSIILRKLSEDEIIFLLSFSDKNYTMEEFKEIKKLLLNKLSGEDIETLSALAEKYGKELDVFVPDI